MAALENGNCQNCRSVGLLKKENTKLKSMIENMKNWFRNLPAEWELKIEEDGDTTGTTDGCQDVNEERPEELNQEEAGDPLDEHQDHVKEECLDVPIQIVGNVQLDPTKEEFQEVPVLFEEEVEEPVPTSSRKRKLNKKYLDFDEDSKKPKDKGFMYTCDLCDVCCTSQSSLSKHKERKHKNNPLKEHKCDQCDYSAKQWTALSHHKNSKHLGIRYECDVCGFAAVTKSQLRVHKETKHEGTKYFCDKCEYSAPRQGDLHQHKQSKHEGIRHLCDQCSSSYATRGDLKKHKQRVHEGVTFSCDECAFVSSFPESVRRHKKTEHKF